MLETSVTNHLITQAVTLLGQDILQLMVKRNLGRKVIKNADLSHGRSLIHNINQLMVHFDEY